MRDMHIDIFGKVQVVCTWKLVPTDKIPAGKGEDKFLPEKIKEIQKDLDDGIDPVEKNDRMPAICKAHIDSATVEFFRLAF